MNLYLRFKNAGLDLTEDYPMSCVSDGNNPSLLNATSCFRERLVCSAIDRQQVLVRPRTKRGYADHTSIAIDAERL